ncbi:DUF6541 family protein [Schaalia sp. lx-260]|uniref:DUF6541 family protein n=1 Tax=Schaalia sp. lx-260 TaxID=2899082 RepID=UPI001E3009BD|nr:DUF6541 family protein [Schaalia sp. lx-260]MCD4548945.1 hypothetical protein [Schaalia sp. lx-260]
MLSALDFFHSWLLFPLALVIAGAVFWLPGLIPSLILGVRRDLLAVFAPIGSVIIVTTSAVFAAVLGVSWGFIPVVAGIAGTALLALLIRLIFRRAIRDEKSGVPENSGAFSYTHTDFLRWGLLAIICVTITIHFAWQIKMPGAFSQTWDNTYHLNAVQAILDTGNASTLNMDLYDVTLPRRHYYYPGAWHDLISLICLSVGVPVSVATNAFTVIVSFLYWPLTTSTLARVAFGKRLVTLLSIPLSLAFPQFPLGFIWYGVLYSNLLSYALLPASIAFTVLGLRRFSRITGWYALLAAAGAVAMVITQANAAVLFAITFCVIAGVYLARRMNHSPDVTLLRKIINTLGATVFTALLLTALNFALDKVGPISVMRRGYEYSSPQGNIIQALMQLGTLTGGNPTNDFGIYTLSEMLPLGIMVALGMLLSLIHGRARWTVACYAIWSCLFIACFAAPPGPIHVYWAGIWYCDLPRLAGALIVLAPIFAAYAIFCFIEWLQKHFLVLRSNTLIAVVLVLLSICIPVNHSLTSVWHRVADNFRITNSSFVDSDELALFQWMSQNLPQGSAVLGNPWEGAPFAWAIGHTRTVFPKMEVDFRDSDYELLATSLKDSTKRQEVCNILNRQGARYILDLDDSYIWGGSGWNAEKRYPSFDEVDNSGVGKVIQQVGKAKLVEITMCE